MSGYNSSSDARVRADLLLAAAGATDGGAETLIATADGPPPPGDGFHLRTWIDTTLCGPAMGNAGDGLILRITYVNTGADLFGSIDTSLKIP